MLEEKLLSFEVGERINLFELDATRLGGSVSRFTDANRTVRMGGQVYAAIRITSSGWDWTTQGTVPRPQLKVSNVTKIGSSLVIGFDDVKGAVLTRKRTLSRYLDDGVEPNPGAFINPIDVYVVERKLTHNKFEISWQLASVADLESVMIPFRQVLRACQYIYRFYDDTAPVSDPFNYEKVTCPYVGQEYFDRSGNTVTDPSTDKCGKRLSDCKKRFGETAELPFGGFPGVARIR